MPFPGGFRIFPLQNPQATCAGYSQTWLALSLMGGAPVLNPGLIGNQLLMTKVHATAKQPTVGSLDANGMAIVGSPVVLNNALWKDAFWRLARGGSGCYYYLTVKNPHHAMACYLDRRNTVYYLEPEDGLSWFPSLVTFVAGAATWYEDRCGQPTNQEFKIYQVAPDGTQQLPATKPRPIIGSHRM